MTPQLTQRPSSYIAPNEPDTQQNILACMDAFHAEQEAVKAYVTALASRECKAIYFAPNETQAAASIYLAATQPKAEAPTPNPPVTVGSWPVTKIWLTNLGTCVYLKFSNGKIAFRGITCSSDDTPTEAQLDSNPFITCIYPHSPTNTNDRIERLAAALKRVIEHGLVCCRLPGLRNVAHCIAWEALHPEDPQCLMMPDTTPPPSPVASQHNLSFTEYTRYCAHRGCPNTKRFFTPDKGPVGWLCHEHYRETLPVAPEPTQEVSDAWKYARKMVSNTGLHPLDPADSPKIGRPWIGEGVLPWFTKTLADHLSAFHAAQSVRDRERIAELEEINNGLRESNEYSMVLHQRATTAEARIAEIKQGGKSALKRIQDAEEDSVHYRKSRDAEHARAEKAEAEFASLRAKSEAQGRVINAYRQMSSLTRTSTTIQKLTDAKAALSALTQGGKP